MYENRFPKVYLGSNPGAGVCNGKKNKKNNRKNNWNCSPYWILCVNKNLYIRLLQNLFVTLRNRDRSEAGTLNHRLWLLSEVIAMKITSPAFCHKSNIPATYTCDGEDKIPPLIFTDVPKEAKSLVLIVEDPDAPGGTWDHWILFNMPQSTKGIEAGTEPKVPHGTNSWKRTAWGGPCPPSGTHRYFFKLYALDILLPLQEGASKHQIQKAMQGHILAEAELIGLYARKRKDD